MKYIILLIIVTITNCSKSLVYSTSVNISNEPLKEKEIDLFGGMELLPEARAENLGGNQTTLGLNGHVGYGFSDKFNLAVKGWVDIEGRENLIRSGYSITGQFLKLINLNKRLIILPRIGIALYGNDISGYGISNSILYHQKLNNNFAFYGGAGIAWGFEDLEKRKNFEEKSKIPIGFGVIGNFGLVWKFIEKFRINLELNPLYQINTFDDNQQFIISPQIGIGYTIKNNE